MNVYEAYAYAIMLVPQYQWNFVDLLSCWIYMQNVVQHSEIEWPNEIIPDHVNSFIAAQPIV